MSVVLIFIAKTILPIAGLLWAEHNVIRTKIADIYALSSVLPVPKAFGAVILVNIITTGLFLIILGVRVGAARTAFKDKAAKDGDRDAEARFSYPKMYAEGFSEHAKLFNCVQRGHQQPLETYTQFVVMSVLGGLTFPVSTMLAGLLWLLARYFWAEGYKSGEPSKRYQNWLAYGIWTSIIMLMAASVSTAVMVML